jgi:hypothetical protein
MKKMNGNPLSLDLEERGPSERKHVHDGLSRQVSEACDRFWIRRKLASPFSPTWFALQGMKRSGIQSKT